MTGKLMVAEDYEWDSEDEQWKDILSNDPWYFYSEKHIKRIAPEFHEEFERLLER